MASTPRGVTTHGVTMTFDLFEELLDALVDGKSINSWCKRPNRPTSATLYKWIRVDPQRAEQVRIARELGGHALLDQTLDIADETEEDPASRNVKIAARKHLAAVYNARLRDSVKVAVTDDGRVAQSLDAALKEITALLALARARAEANAGALPAPDKLDELLS